MPASSAKRKLVKLAKACLPPAASRAAVRACNDSHSGDPGCRPDWRIMAGYPVHRPANPWHGHRLLRERTSNRARQPDIRCITPLLCLVKIVSGSVLKDWRWVWLGGWRWCGRRGAAGTRTRQGRATPGGGQARIRSRPARSRWVPGGRRIVRRPAWCGSRLSGQAAPGV